MLRYVPLRKRAPVEFSASSPIVAVYRSGDHFTVSHGNRRVTRLYPQYFEYDDSLSELTVEADGRTQVVRLGSVVPAAESFMVAPQAGTYYLLVHSYSGSGSYTLEADVA